MKIKYFCKVPEDGTYTFEAVLVLLFSKQVSRVDIRSEVKRGKPEPERNHEHTVIIFGDP